MALINPTLLTATGSTLQIAALATGQSLPPQVKFAVTNAAINATSLTVTTTLPSGTTTFSLKNGTYIKAPNQVIIVDGDQTITAASSTITIDPLTLAISSATTLRTYVGALPLIGLEAANLQLTKEVNQAVLLASRSWQNRDYSTGSWQLSGNLYSPRDILLADAYNLVYQALLTEKYLYCERYLADGDYFAGIGIVTDLSDTAQGAQYITKSLTIQGSGRPVTAVVIVP